MKTKSYLEKLKDPRWQRKRLEIFQRDDWKCVECGDYESTLHVHHEEYSGADPWDTPSDKLKTLCEDCHSKKGSKINQIEVFLEKVGVKFWIAPVWLNEGDEEKYLISISDL
jgi:5-methylcytosine-specific restriction endonuclease McrA